MKKLFSKLFTGFGQVTFRIEKKGENGTYSTLPLLSFGILLFSKLIECEGVTDLLGTVEINKGGKTYFLNFSGGSKPQIK